MKKVIALLCLLGLLLSFTGCHKAKLMEPFEIPGVFDESKTYEITFWAKNENNVNQQNVYKQAVEEFQKLYPNIKVQMKQYGDYKVIYNDVITNIATSSTPNVCITYPDHIATYLEGENTVVPLDALMTDSRYGLGGSMVKFDSPAVEEIVPEFLEECIVNGNYYALPYMRSTEACYINKDFVEQLGYEVPEVLTWDFIWEVSEKAMEKNEDGTFKLNGQKTMIPCIYKSTDNMMITMLRQNGGDYSTGRGEVQIFNDTTADILKEIFPHAQSRAFATFQTSSYPANFLNKGQCIFAIDSTAGATWMGCDAPLLDVSTEELKQFETVVRPVPQRDTDNISMISQGPSVCIFNKEDPQEVLASWLFVQYLLTDGIQIAYSQTEGYVPVTTSAQQSKNYQDYLSRRGEDNQLHYSVKLDAVNMLLEYTDKTFVTPVFNGSADLRQAAGDMIEETTKSARRKGTMNDAFIQELYSNQSSLHHLDEIKLRDEQGVAYGNKEQFGALPAGSVVLLAGLGLVWLGMSVWVIAEFAKKKRKRT